MESYLLLHLRKLYPPPWAILVSRALVWFVLLCIFYIILVVMWRAKLYYGKILS